MARVKIDRGVPMVTQARHRPAKYPWAKMEVGDSFLFPRGLRDETHYNQALAASKKYGRTFRVRKTPDGYRCWRTE